MDAPSSNTAREDSSRFSLRSVYRRCRSWIQNRNKDRTRKIIRTKDGFTMHAGADPIWSICWEEVTGVIAFKRDLYTTDQICLGFRVLENESEIWSIDEDTDGYQSIAEDVAKLTQNAWPDRWHEVAFPAFETKWTQLWIAEGSTRIVDSDETMYIY